MRPRWQEIPDSVLFSLAEQAEDMLGECATIRELAHALGTTQQAIRDCIDCQDLPEHQSLDLNVAYIGGMSGLWDLAPWDQQVQASTYQRFY